MTHQTIAQGAEAKIILTTLRSEKSSSLIKSSAKKSGKADFKANNPSASEQFIIKDRIPKSYRLKELDEKIRRRRTKSEAKLLEKASNIINAPTPIITSSHGWVKLLGSDKSSPTNNDFPMAELGGDTPTKILMPFIQGQKLSEHLDSFPLTKQKQICKKIGESIAKLHDEDIIHGDLTTSNMILTKSNKTSEIKKTDNKKSSPLINSTMSEQSEPIVFFIDFGLGFISHKFEDKAVDLHLLKQALEAKHFKNWEELVEKVIKGYKKSKDFKIVLERLKAVEKRGRYKH